jgi:hypothetical protein
MRNELLYVYEFYWKYNISRTKYKVRENKLSYINDNRQLEQNWV